MRVLFEVTLIYQAYIMVFIIAYFLIAGVLLYFVYCLENTGEEEHKLRRSYTIACSFMSVLLVFSAFWFLDKSDIKKVEVENSTLDIIADKENKPYNLEEDKISFYLRDKDGFAKYVSSDLENVKIIEEDIDKPYADVCVTNLWQEKNLLLVKINGYIVVEDPISRYTIHIPTSKNESEADDSSNLEDKEVDDESSYLW